MVSAVDITARLRAPILVLYAALFVVLLPAGLIPSNIHSILNRSMAALALGVWLFSEDAWRRPIWSTTTSLMLAFLLWSGFSLLWAKDIHTGMTILLTYTLRFLVFLFLVPNLIRNRKELDGLMYVLALAGWVLLLIGAGTILTGGYTFGTRFKVLDENENGPATLALIAMIGVLWHARRSPGSKATLGLIIASIFLLMTMGLVALSGSRGGAISLLIVLLAFCCWRPSRGWGKLGLAALVLAIILTPAIFKATSDRFAASTDNYSSDTALGGREPLWKAGLQLIGDHPLSGVGIGNSGFEIRASVVRVRAIDDQDDAPVGNPMGKATSIHNPIVVIGAETGLPGLLLYLGVIITAFWSFLRDYQKCRNLGAQNFIPYFALVTSVFLGYMASWIKGGGMESSHTFFLLLSLLLIPSALAVRGFEHAKGPNTETVTQELNYPRPLPVSEWR